MIQVSAPTTNAEEAEVDRFYEDLQDLLELLPKKGVLFIIGNWNAKVGSQEIPTQVWPRSIRWSKAKASRVMPRECTGHSKHPLPTAQEMTLRMDMADGQYRNQIDYIICSWRWRSSTQSAKTRPGAAVPQIINSLLPNLGSSWIK